MSSFSAPILKCHGFNVNEEPCGSRPSGHTSENLRTFCKRHGMGLEGWTVGLPPFVEATEEEPPDTILLGLTIADEPFSNASLEMLKQDSLSAQAKLVFPFMSTLLGASYRSGMPMAQVALQLLKEPIAIPDHASGLFPAGRTICMQSFVGTYHSLCTNDFCLLELMAKAICGDADVFANLITGMDAVSLPSEATTTSAALSASASTTQAVLGVASSPTPLVLVIEGVHGAPSAKAFMLARLKYATNRLAAFIKSVVDDRLSNPMSSDKVQGLLPFSRVGQLLGGRLFINPDEVHRLTTLLGVASSRATGSLHFPSAIALMHTMTLCEAKLDELGFSPTKRHHATSATGDSVWTLVAEMISQKLHGADVNATQAQTNLLNRRAQASTAEACISPLCVGFLDSTTLACLVCKMFGRPNARKDELTNAQLQAKSTSALNAYADSEQTLTEERAAFSVAQIKALVDQVSARAVDMLTQAKAEGIDSLDRVAISAILNGTGDDKIVAGANQTWKPAPGLLAAFTGTMTALCRDRQLATPDSPGTEPVLAHIVHEQYHKVPLGTLLRTTRATDNNLIGVLALGLTAKKASQFKLAAVRSAPLFERYLNNLRDLVFLFNKTDRVAAGFIRVQEYLSQAREFQFSFMEFLKVYISMLQEHAAHIALYISDPSTPRPDAFEMSTCPTATKMWGQFRFTAAARGPTYEDSDGWWGFNGASNATTEPASPSSRPAKKQRKQNDSSGAGAGSKRDSNTAPKRDKTTTSPTPTKQRSSAPRTEPKQAPAAWRASLPEYLHDLQNNRVCICIKRTGGVCDCAEERVLKYYKLGTRYCKSTKDDPLFKKGSVPDHFFGSNR